MYIFISSPNIAKNCIFFYIAVQHTGVGYTQINGILAELNIPPISKTLLYTRQEEVGQATESVASSSINDALQEEVEATTKYGCIFLNDFLVCEKRNHLVFINFKCHNSLIFLSL